MFAQIPTLPKPLLLGAGAVCLLVGVVLILWGRSHGRIMLALLMAGGGAACGPMITQWLPFGSVWPVSLAAAAFAGALGFALATIVWAILLGGGGAIAALIALAILTTGLEKPVWGYEQTEDWWVSCANMGDYLRSWLWALWCHSPAAVAACAGVPAAIGLGVGMFFPKAIVIVASSVLGAAKMVAGSALLVWAIQGEWAAAWAKHLYIPAAVVGVLALLGGIFQTRAHLRAVPKTIAEADLNGRSGDKPPTRGGDGAGDRA